MLSPYALTRPGGVQGQALGLARSLRALGHDVIVLGPADEGVPVPAAAGEHFVIGRPVGVHTNGSVAPVALSPAAAARAERFVSRGGFDVLHAHEPLAPVAAYGLVLTAPLPMVGTYHRAGVSRWVPVLKPLAALVGRRMQVRVAVSEAARQTGLRSGAGPFEVLFNGVDMQPLRDGRARTPRAGTSRRPVPRAPRAAQGAERAPRCVREGRAAGGPVGGGRRPGERGPAAPPSRVGPGALVGCAERRGGRRPTGGGRRAVRAVTARRVLRHGAARGDGGGLRRGGLRHRGVPDGGRRARGTGPPGRRARAVPCPRRRAWPTPSRAAGSRRPRRARRRPSTPAPGRWTPSPSATSTSTPGPSPPTG